MFSKAVAFVPFWGEKNNRGTFFTFTIDQHIWQEKNVLPPATSSSL